MSYAADSFMVATNFDCGKGSQLITQSVFSEHIRLLTCDLLKFYLCGSRFGERFMRNDLARTLELFVRHGLYDAR